MDTHQTMTFIRMAATIPLLICIVYDITWPMTALLIINMIVWPVTIHYDIKADPDRKWRRGLK